MLKVMINECTVKFLNSKKRTYVLRWEWDGSSGRGSYALAVHWCAGAAPRRDARWGRGRGGEECGCGEQWPRQGRFLYEQRGPSYYSRSPRLPLSLVLHALRSEGARFSTRSPLQKLRTPHSAIVFLSLSHLDTVGLSISFSVGGLCVACNACVACLVSKVECRARNSLDPLLGTCKVVTCAWVKIVIVVGTLTTTVLNLMLWLIWGRI